MKKSRMLFTAMAVALTLGAFQVEAKSAARERFDDSLSRVKKCFKGKCTRMEALKAARDLGAAAVVTIAGMYVAGKGLEKGARAMGSRDYAVGTAIVGEKIGRGMQYPAEATRAGMQRGAEAARSGMRSAGRRTLGSVREVGSRASGAGQALAEKYREYRGQGSSSQSAME